jgi:hypothetical protein
MLFADVPVPKLNPKQCAAITLTPEGSPARISGDWNLADVRMVPGVKAYEECRRLRRE